MKPRYSNGHSRRDSLRKARRREEHAAYSMLEKIRRGGCELSGRKLKPNELEWHHPDPSQKRRTICKMLPLGHEQFLKEIWSCQCIGRDVHRALHQFPEKSIPEILSHLGITRA